MSPSDVSPQLLFLYGSPTSSTGVHTGSDEKEWQENLYRTAYEEGMTNRNWENFRPDRAINAQEMYVITSRAADWAERTGGCTPKPENIC